uniref:Uncharacterized protein n=1 Tax=Schistocephalus solidus TaxID=70667 RepID=A0A0X3PWB2_SCHSO
MLYSECVMLLLIVEVSIACRSNPTTPRPETTTTAQTAPSYDARIPDEQERELMAEFLLPSMNALSEILYSSPIREHPAALALFVSNISLARCYRIAHLGRTNDYDCENVRLTIDIDIFKPMSENVDWMVHSGSIKNVADVFLNVTGQLILDHAEPACRMSALHVKSVLVRDLVYPPLCRKSAIDRGLSAALASMVKNMQLLCSFYRIE